MERAVVLVAHRQSWVRLSRWRKSSEHLLGLAFPITHPPGLAFPEGLVPSRLCSPADSDLISMR